MRTRLRRLWFLLPLYLSSSDACMRVTPTESGIPATPACQKCNPALITKIETGTAGQKPFNTDGTAVVNGCFERTLVCTGFSNAGIEINPPGTRIGDGGTTASLTLRCNAAGTAWIEPNTLEVVTSLDCSANPEPMPCQECAQDLITLVEDDPAGGTPFDSDTTVTVDGCLVRTIVCKGPGAFVEVKTTVREGPIFGGDQGTPGTVTIKVTCNGAGTGWIFQGEVVTRLSCSTTANCNSCKPEMITKVETGTTGQKTFTSDMTSTVNGCLQRELVCEGTKANVRVNGGGIIFDTDQGTPGTVTITAMCKSDGSAWAIPVPPPDPPVAVTQLECSAAVSKCTQCAQALISTAPASAGAIAFEMDTTETVNGCAVRTMVCEGFNAIVEFNNGEDSSLDDATLGTPGVVSIELVCNEDGNEWEFIYMGNPPVPMTTLQCSVAPACGNCDPALITANGFASDMTITETMCLKRTLTCEGPDATIEVNGGAIDPVVGVCTAKTAEIVVRCNADGSAWEYMGMTVTALECTTSGPSAPPSQSCPQCLITKTTSFNGVWGTDTTMIVGGNSVRTVICTGANPSLAINDAGELEEETPGAGVRFEMTCNAAGTAWFMFQDITKLDCSSP